MASWGVHLRIADFFLDSIDKEHHREFVIGNVAPDCGYGEKDSFGEFTPPPTVTHWSPSGMKRDCEYKKFYDTYLEGEKDTDYWFYLGYYVHLLTDIIWSMTMYMPTRIKYKKEYKENPEFLKVIKRDWNDIDFKFLRDNETYVPYEVLHNAGEIKQYLPYYEKDQLTVQIKFIVDYYKNYNGDCDRVFEYTQTNEIDNFIECTCRILEIILKKEELI